MTDQPKRKPEVWLTTKYPGLYRLDGYDDRWRYRIYDPRSGKTIQPRVSGVGIREAKAQMDKARAEAQRFGKRRHGRPKTVREFGDMLRETSARAAGTADSLERDLQRHVYPVLGHLRIDEVTHLHAMKFQQRLKATGLAVSTQGKIEANARALFNAAVAADEILGRSPFARLPRILKGKPEAQLRQGEYIPSMTEAVRMADLAWERGRVDLWAFILWTIGTGMRSGEIRGTSAQQIDYPKPTRIYVDQQICFDRVDGLGGEDGKGIHYYTTPKSSAGKRLVPTAPFVVDAIATLTAWRAPREITLPFIDDAGVVRDAQTRMILMPGAFGGPMHKTVMSKLVGQFAADAGVAPIGLDGQRLRVTPNTLRKVLATVLDNAPAVPRKVIDYVTGHASEGITLRHYTDVTDPGLTAMRNAAQAAYVAARAEVDAAKDAEQTATD